MIPYKRIIAASRGSTTSMHLTLLCGWWAAVVGVTERMLSAMRWAPRVGKMQQSLSGTKWIVIRDEVG